MPWKRKRQLQGIRAWEKIRNKKIEIETKVYKKEGSEGNDVNSDIYEAGNESRKRNCEDPCKNKNSPSSAETMPFRTKRSVAARARAAAEKRLRQSTAAAPEASEGKFEPQLLVPGESSFPLELTFHVEVKQEPTSTENEDQFLPQDELEVKEELLLDPDRSDPIDPEQDPIGQDGSRSLLQQQQQFNKDELDDRCQFCLELFQERGGRAVVTKIRVRFVLGLSNWGTPGMFLDCCEECRKMFDMFYEFKQGCLVALARPAELFVAGNKGQTTEPASARRGQISDSEPMDDCNTLKESSKLVEPEMVGTEACPVNLHHGVRQTESTICSEKVSDGMAPRQDLIHHSADSNESNSKSTALVQDKSKCCQRCGKWFPDKEVFLQHKPNCACIRKPKKRSSSTFACSLCPKKFTNERELAYHTDMHNGIRTIPCRREGCTKMFYHPNVRRKHESICGPGIQAICNICGASFRSEDSLHKHSVTHGDPRYSCELCNKSFYWKRYLNKHSAVHSDERRFQCHVCGKQFKSYEANRVHQRIHTDETPYVCHLCGQQFRYNCLLKTHMEKRHELVSPG